MLALILSLILHVHADESINNALDSARAVYAAHGERTTIVIEPGTYQEELTIDIPGLTLKNASRKPSIALKNGGVDCDKNAVRITWYYGHGYQYRSMGNRINYGGSRERRWNASVLVTAPDFTAENIIFEKSGKFVLIDFNIATNNVNDLDKVGTWPYLAPDLMNGQTMQWEDSADTFALGVTLYELLTHSYPWPGKRIPFLPPIE